MLSFKQITKKPSYRPQPRHTKEYKAYKGKHLPKRKLIGKCHTGDYHAYPRVNMDGWLEKHLDQPIDKVFSLFAKEFKKSYNGRSTPLEFFYSYVDKEKNLNRSWVNFYVAPKGFLCKYHRRNTWRNYRGRHLPSVSHVDHNQKVLKGFSMSGRDLGPRYIGKLWVTTKGFTKLVNVWAVALDKLSKDPYRNFPIQVTRKTRAALAEFTEVTVEGCWKTFTGKDPHSIWGALITYVYVAKLSDFQ